MLPTPADRDHQLARQLGVALTAHRQRKGMSQEAVAHAAGVSRNYYQLLEHGWSVRAAKTPANPTLSVFVALAEALDVEPSKLLTEIYPPLPDVSVELGPLG